MKNKGRVIKGGESVSGVSEQEEVPVLIAEKMVHSESRSAQPSVHEILNAEEVVFDTEEGWGEDSKKLNLIMFSCLLVAVAVVGVSIMVLKQETTEVSSASNIGSPKLEGNGVKKTNKEVEALDGLSQLELALKGYLGAKSLEERLNYVRIPDRVKPMMEHYYSSHDYVSDRYLALIDMHPLYIGGHNFLYVNIKTAQTRANAFILEELSTGEYKVDWESHVSYLPIDWDEYNQKQPKESYEMKVFAEVASVYLYEFSDDEEYDCYRLKTRDSDKKVYAYVKKSSRSGELMRNTMLKAALAGDGKPQAMTLIVHFPRDSNTQGVLVIEEFISPRWIYIEPDGVE